MASGFFEGIVAGSVVCGLVLTAASVVAKFPEHRPNATALEVPAGTEFDTPRQDIWAEIPSAETSPEAGVSIQANAPTLDDLLLLSPEATKSAALPEADNSAGSLSLPDVVIEDKSLETVTAIDSPVMQRPAVWVPPAPENKDALSISTLPTELITADDVSRVVVSSVDRITGGPNGKTAFLDDLLQLPQGPVAENWEQMVRASSPVREIPKQPPAVPSLLMASMNSPELHESKNWVQEAQVFASVPNGLVLPGGFDPMPDVSITKVATSDGQTMPGTTQKSTIVDREDEPETDEPKSGGFDNLAPDVKTNRLPSVTDGAEVEPETVEAEPINEAENDALPNLQKYAAEFENPEAKPLMSIVLIDDGSSNIGVEALKEFPYPISFAIDTKWPGAADAMRTYRDAGFEVLAMADLPKGAGAADTEVTMAIYLRAVPEAVAVMEGEGNGLQSGRKASAQLAQILASSGLGVVMFPKGLNTAQKLIAREGVPAITVFRDFDGDGQSADTIQRFLDRATLKAGQEESGVIMVGRLGEDTINALVVWALEDRAARVAMAPVSAVLRGE